MQSCDCPTYQVKSKIVPLLIKSSTLPFLSPSLSKRLLMATRASSFGAPRSPALDRHVKNGTFKMMRKAATLLASVLEPHRVFLLQSSKATCQRVLNNSEAIPDSPIAKNAILRLNTQGTSPISISSPQRREEHGFPSYNTSTW